jgi:hypothetical protein
MSNPSRYVKVIGIFLLSCFILLFGGVLFARMYISSFVEEQLMSRSITYGESTQTFQTITLHDLEKDNNQVATATLHLQLPPLIHLQGVTIKTPPEFEKVALIENNDENSQHPVRDLLSTTTITVEDLSVILPDLPSVNGLTGTIYPRVKVVNKDIEITFDDSMLQIKGQLPVQTEHLSGLAQFTITPPTQPDNVQITLSEAIVKHPMLGTSLSLLPITIKGSWKKNAIDLVASSTQMNTSITGTVDSSFSHFDVQINSVLPISTLPKMFSIPESQKDLNITGDILLDIQAKGFPIEWTGTLNTTKMSVTGPLFSPQHFRHGTITYRPINSEAPRVFGPAGPEWTSTQNLGWLSLASVVAEDGQFWKHDGININGINRALSALSQDNDRPPGGSSITQQLAKNIFVGNRRTMQRKVQELIYTIALEQYLSKEEILTLYLNAVEFGPNIYGVKAAADVYFLKSPQNLTVVEAVFLISLLRSPRKGYWRAQKNKFNRYRINLILENMKKRKYLTESEFIQAKSAPLYVIPAAP